MAKRGTKRYVNTSLWVDDYLHNILVKENDKDSFIIFLLLLTHPNSHISGTYELNYDYTSVMTGVSPEKIELALARFERDGKIKRSGAWVCIRNFILHQSPSLNMKKSIIHGLLDAPIELVSWLLGAADVLYQVREFPDYDKLQARLAIHKETRLTVAS